MPIDHSHDYNLALGCLDAMNLLHFNICQLKTSYLPNNAVPDLQNKIKSSIPEALQYACRFWSHHISPVPSSPLLLERVQIVLEERFLFWLEVLSVLGLVNSMPMHLHKLQKWVKVTSMYLSIFPANNNVLNHKGH